ncbi:MAG: class I SAM-dependent methyltransferase [bacterium]|nr:class I SAM-dependent methyltransferase [bacterium]
MRPKRAIREIKYRYTFTSILNFPVDLLGTTKLRVRELLDELEREKPFVESVYTNLEAHPPSSERWPMTLEAELLYVLIRLIEPEVVVETGVGAGKSSAFILNAMQKNGYGLLYSIDLPNEKDSSGWVIPENLRDRWDLRLGSSRELLGSLLQEKGPIDIFLHDSDHSYGNMMFEFRTVWQFIKRNGLFLAHDVGRNDALFDFCHEVNVSWTRVRTFHVLSGIIKPS